MVQKLLLSEKVAESIKSAIDSGFYQSGYQMPNEIQLAEELKVSRATLREAIKILISENVLEVKRGIGTFISSKAEFSPSTLGLEFSELGNQISEISTTMKKLDEEELMSFVHLSESTQQDLIANLNLAPTSPTQILGSIFDFIEKIALSKQSTFNHRMLIFAHTAFIYAAKVDSIKMNERLIILYSHFIEAVQDESIVRHYDDVIRTIRQLAQEV